MSSAPAETKVNLPSTKDDGEATKTDLVVRRRAGLMGLVALTSLALSAGYLVAFGRSQDGIALVVGSMLGIVAILHLSLIHI